MEKSNKNFILTIVLFALLLSAWGTSSSYSGGTSYRSVNHYHHANMNAGWGRPYYGNDVIIIDNGPDIIDDIGMPEAVDLPMDDW